MYICEIDLKDESHLKCEFTFTVAVCFELANKISAYSTGY